MLFRGRGRGKAQKFKIKIFFEIFEPPQKSG